MHSRLYYIHFEITGYPCNVISSQQLINYIEKHDILFQFQFGFRKGHSRAEDFSEIADNLREAMDNNLYTCGVFIDF